MKPNEYARRYASRIWNRHTDRTLRQERNAAARLNSTGEYLGYVADTERHRVRASTGKIIEAQTITNAGLQEGDSVVLQGDRFKSMPR
jgi:hypothetical protein